MSDSDTSTFTKLTELDTYSILGITVPRPSTEWVSAFSTALLWNYQFFKNPDGTPNEWSLIKWLIFVPISTGMIVSLTVTFLPLLLQGVKAARALLPF